MKNIYVKGYINNEGYTFSYEDKKLNLRIRN